MPGIANSIRTVWIRLGDWFDTEGDPRSPAAMRILFSGIVLFLLWDFYPSMELLFGKGGLYSVVPRDHSPINPFSVLYFHNEPWILELWFWATVGAAGLSLVGLRSNISFVAMYFGLVLFQERGEVIIYGADALMRHFGLWLCFAEKGQSWSIDSWRAGGMRTPVPYWPLRMIQVQVTLVYGVTGLAKLSTPIWQEGAALFYSLQWSGASNRLGVWLAQHRMATAILTYWALLLELAFPILVWWPPTRLLILAMGVGLHAGIDLFMHIRFFFFTMLLGYLSFLGGSDWDKVILRPKFRLSRLSFRKR